MTKVMRYENGKAIAGQVDAPFKVNWSDWINMTDAQKKGKKWLIENVPGAEGEIDAELFTPLWTNPNPSSQFAAQNITLASGDYDLLMWVFSYSSAGTNYKVQMCIICEKGADAFLNYATGGTTRSRNCNYISDTVYAIQAGYTNQTVDNSNVIPITIYGFKKTVKIKFDALAKDVSTLASKCMMPDGETSVEEELNSLVRPHKYSVVLGNVTAGTQIAKSLSEITNGKITLSSQVVALTVTNAGGNSYQDFGGALVASNNTVLFNITKTQSGGGFEIVLWY